MARAPRGSGSSQRPRAEARAPRETAAGSASYEAPTRTLDSRPSEAAVPRFRIFIIDSGWNSPAHKVLQENFGLIRDLQKADLRPQQGAVDRVHPSPPGADRPGAVHRRARPGGDGQERDYRLPRLPFASRPYAHATAGAAGFAELCPLNTHRQSADLEAEIRTDLRREGLAGAIDIIMHHEAREIGE